MQKMRIQNAPSPRRWLIVIGGTLVVGAVLIGIMARLSPISRDWFLNVLRERYASEIELRDFRVSPFPRIRVTGEGLVFRHKGRTDVPPLVTIKQFSFEMGLLGFLRSPRRVQRLRLEGLQIIVPPKEGEGERHEKRRDGTGIRRSPFIIEEINADGTSLKILPKERHKEPLAFDIYRLTLHSVGVDRPLTFRATLSKPKPPGEIQSAGEFGPWQSDEPRLTPVSGRYRFEKADLSVFRGLEGILSSEGNYMGVLERIEVQGQTDTPDFTVKISGNPVHLKTQFRAVVNGTSGDTILESVDARFLHSSIFARGGVIGTRGVKGKRVSLDVRVDKARLEDLLRLAVKSAKVPMTGTVGLRTRFELPPGETDIADRLYLNGRFGIGTARFTDSNVQEKMDNLSRRAKGRSDENDTDNVISNLEGHFVLKDSNITFSDLSFGVPGALVRLSGTYGLRSEQLDFRGTLRLQAKLSETTTGFKSFLLKAVDPLFKGKNAGAVLPIKITGTRQQPSFGLDIGKIRFKPRTSLSNRCCQDLLA